LEQLVKTVSAFVKLLDAWPSAEQQLPCRAEQLIIEKLITEKVEIKLESMDINELSGILNIGQSYHSKIIRQSPHERQPVKSQSLPVSPRDMGSPRIRINY